MKTTAQAADRRSDELGKRGEDLAAEYLAGTGLVLLSRNWRCQDGEGDLVATDGVPALDPSQSDADSTWLRLRGAGSPSTAGLLAAGVNCLTSGTDIRHEEGPAFTRRAQEAGFTSFRWRVPRRLPC